MSFSLRSLRNLCVLCVLSFSFETLLDRDMNKRQAGLLALILFTIVAILHLIHLEKWAVLDETLLMGLRWTLVASLVWFAILKRSLTT